MKRKLRCRWCGEVLDNSNLFKNVSPVYSTDALDFCKGTTCFEEWNVVNDSVAFITLVPFDFMLDLPIGEWRRAWLEGNPNHAHILYSDIKRLRELLTISHW